MKWDMERMRMDHDLQRMHREMEHRAHGPRPQRAQSVSGPRWSAARAPLPWDFEVVLPKDLVPLVGFKVRVLGFRPRDRKGSSWSKARSSQEPFVAMV